MGTELVNNCDYSEMDGKDLTKLVVNGADEHEICRLPITIDESRVAEGAVDIIKAIRPHWKLEQIHFKMFTDGITNKLVGCFYDPSVTISATEENGVNDDAGKQNNLQISGDCVNSLLPSGTCNDSSKQNGDTNTDSPASIIDTMLPGNVLLVRVYGNKTDMLIDRKAETRNIKLLHRYGFAPQLFAIFKNGLAYEYVPGRTLSPQTVIQPNIWKLIASRMAQMHKVDCGDKIRRTPMLPGTMQKFFDLVPETFSDPAKHERLKDVFLPVRKLRAEFDDLLGRLEKFHSPVVFAHNDLLLTNIIYTESLNRVTFIDYEYAAYNFQAFDIGNHFTEFAGVDEIDYSRYPDKEFQLNWLRVYLEEYKGSPDFVSEDDVERLYVQVNQFALAAHYLWTVWALIQTEYSNIDFDYAQYAHLRYGEYQAKRDEFLSLEYRH